MPICPTCKRQCVYTAGRYELACPWCGYKGAPAGWSAERQDFSWKEAGSVNRGTGFSGNSISCGSTPMDSVIVYGVMEPSTPAYPGTSIGWPIETTISVGGLSPEEHAQLKRIEEKLDTLLLRTSPEAQIVEEVRRRVLDALDGLKPRK